MRSACLRPRSVSRLPASLAASASASPASACRQTIRSMSVIRKAPMLPALDDATMSVAGLRAGLGLQSPVLRHQLLARLAAVGIERDAVDRADLPALRLVEVPDAFGASIGVDDVDLGTHRNGPVRALRLADVAVDALVGDDQRHRHAPRGLTGAVRRAARASCAATPAPMARRTW